MSTPDRMLLLRYLHGDLPVAKRHRVEQMLKDDAEAKAQLARLRALQHTLQSADRSFDDGFAGRVLGRLPEPEPVRERAGLFIDPALYDALQGMFVRVALAAALLIGGVGGYNIAMFDDDAASPVEAALGLPDATLQAAAYDTLLPPEE